MTYINNFLDKEPFQDYSNNIFNNNSSNYIFKEQNEYNDYTKNELGTKNLVYKSIFPQKEAILKNRLNKHNNFTNERINFQLNRNGNMKYSNKTNIVPKNKQRKLFNIVDNSKENNNSISNDYYNNDYSMDVNNLGKFINNNIKYSQNSSNNKNRTKYRINSCTTSNTENGRNIGIDIYRDIKSKKNSIAQKSDDNFNNILDKNDFIKNVREIEDLNILDEIDKKNDQYFSTAENINIINIGNPYVSSNERYEKGINIIKKMPLTSKSKNNTNAGDNILRKNSSNKEQIIKPKIKINEHRNFYNKTYKNKLIVNDVSIYNNTENFNLQNNNVLTSITNRGIEEEKTLQKNLSFEDKHKQNIVYKKNNYAHSSNKYGNKNIIKKIPNISDLKENIKRLNLIIKEKINKINSYERIIKQYKEKMNNIMQNNIKLNEEKKKNQFLLNKYRNEIINLRDRLERVNKIDIVNQKYNSEQKIKELEKQLNNYMKENKELKLLIQNRNNQKSINEEINPRENLLSKFNTSSFIYENRRKKSYSVSKNRNNLSFFSTKTFQEDEIELKNDIKIENNYLN